jgi:hypothetical protein
MKVHRLAVCMFCDPNWCWECGVYAKNVQSYIVILHQCILFTPVTINRWLMISIQFSWFQTFAVFCMLYVFFWVISWRLNFICQPTCLWRWNRQSVLEHWQIKFRHWGITQKKTYNKYIVNIQIIYKNIW